MHPNKKVGPALPYSHALTIFPLPTGDWPCGLLTTGLVRIALTESSTFFKRSSSIGIKKELPSSNPFSSCAGTFLLIWFAEISHYQPVPQLFFFFSRIIRLNPKGPHFGFPLTSFRHRSMSKGSPSKGFLLFPIPSVFFFLNTFKVAPFTFSI